MPQCNEELYRFDCYLQSPATPDTAVVDVNDPSDQQVEKIEQERLVLQLKEMIRDRENALTSKDAELKVSLLEAIFLLEF